MIDSKALLTALQKQVKLCWRRPDARPAWPTPTAPGRVAARPGRRPHRRHLRDRGSATGSPRSRSPGSSAPSSSASARTTASSSTRTSPARRARSPSPATSRPSSSQQHPEQTDRDWIIAGFDAMSVSPVAAGPVRPAPQPDVDDPRRPTTRPRPCSPSGADRRQTARSSTTSPTRSWNTRFLGDLYQDLSEARPEDLRPAPDPGVRRGVHPQVHAGPRDRGVRPGPRPARTATPTCRTACA